MNTPLIPESYEDWQYCITELCRIPLTREFVEGRVSALRDLRDFETQKFLASWGDAHRKRVISWFEMVQQELQHGSISKAGGTVAHDDP